MRIGSHFEDLNDDEAIINSKLFQRAQRSLTGIVGFSINR